MELNVATPPERVALPGSQENITHPQTTLQIVPRIPVNSSDSVSANNPSSAIGSARARWHGVMPGGGASGSQVPLRPALHEMKIPRLSARNITHPNASSLYPSPAKFWSPDLFAGSSLMAFEGGEAHSLTVTDVGPNVPSGVSRPFFLYRYR